MMVDAEREEGEMRFRILILAFALASLLRALDLDSGTSH
jgi:hypothetical protein